MEGGGARGISREKGRTIAFGILNVKSDCTQQRKLIRGDTHAWEEVWKNMSEMED